MPDFLPVPPTSAITDKQTRAVLDVLAQNIQVSIDKFSALNAATNTTASVSKGGFTSFGTGTSSITNNTSLSASYTKSNMIADSAALFAAKLNKSASDILSGPIDFTTYGGFKTSGMTIASDGTATGQGVAFTSKGIVGRNSTTTTFTLDSTTGDANFYGNISGGANINISGQAIFSGNNPGSSFPITVQGTTYSLYYSAEGISPFAGATPANSSNVGLLGIGASTSGGTGSFNIGVVGLGYTGSGIPNSIGGFFNGTTFASYHQGSVVFDGTILYWNGTTVSGPPASGGVNYFLRGDGNWALIGSIGGGTVTSVSGTGTVSGLTLTGTVTTAGSLTLGGSLSLTSGQITSGLGYTPYNGSTNPNGYITNSTSSLTNYTTTTATLSYLSANYTPTGYAAHQFNADSGTAYVSAGNINIYVTITGFQSAGSGNTITIQSVSDRALKQNIVPEILGLDFIKSLIPVSYSMIKGDGRKMHGFIAQDVAPLIEEDNDALKITNPDGTKGIDYLSLIAPMTKAIQELSAKVDALEAKLAETRT